MSDTRKRFKGMRCHVRLLRGGFVRRSLRRWHVLSSRGLGRSSTWDQCYDSLNIFAETIGKNIGGFLLNLLVCAKN
jgi:hypothetical protein